MAALYHYCQVIDSTVLRRIGGKPDTTTNRCTMMAGCCGVLKAGELELPSVILKNR
jgi:hypothetical protein